MREQIFKLYSGRLVVEAEQQKLEERLKEIEKIEGKKLRRIFGLMSIWYSAQFAVSYYTIFCVPWLGWDLVEPLTYTISQGSMVLGLAYMYRHRGVGTEYTQLNKYW